MKFQGMHPGRVSIYAREVWSTLDTDGDGKISKAEAMHFISRRVFRADCMLMTLPHCMLIALPHCMLIALPRLATRRRRVGLCCCCCCGNMEAEHDETTAENDDEEAIDDAADEIQARAARYLIRKRAQQPQMQENTATKENAVRLDATAEDAVLPRAVQAAYDAAAKTAAEDEALATRARAIVAPSRALARGQTIAKQMALGTALRSEPKQPKHAKLYSPPPALSLSAVPSATGKSTPHPSPHPSSPSPSTLPNTAGGSGAGAGSSARDGATTLGCGSSWPCLSGGREATPKTSPSGSPRLSTAMSTPPPRGPSVRFEDVDA